MLNISNIERISEILGMDPEEVTEFDIDDASDELDPNSEEWLIMIEALRELDGGKSNLLFNECNSKREIQINKYENKKQLKSDLKNIKLTRSNIKYTLNTTIDLVSLTTAFIPDPKFKVIAKTVIDVSNLAINLVDENINMIDEENVKEVKEDIKKTCKISKKSYNKFMKGLKRK